MGVKLQGLYDGTIPARELPDGEVAVIVDHPYDAYEYVGRIVQRFDDILISIGMPFEDGWPSIDSLPDSFRVRVLDPGETIEVTP